MSQRSNNTPYDKQVQINTKDMKHSFIYNKKDGGEAIPIEVTEATPMGLLLALTVEI